MFVKFLSFLFVILPLRTSAQALTTIQGQLFNKETNAPVVFANVHTNGYGTSSNQLGRFTLSFNKELNDTVFTISCIGYETKQVAIKNIESEIKIFLVPKTEVLGEVVILSITPTQILKRAYNSLVKNYKTSVSSAKFTLDQYIFDDADSLLGYSRTNGLSNDQLVDSSRMFPKIRIDSITITEGFLKYDTVSKMGFNIKSPVVHSLSPYFFLSTNSVKHFLSASPYPEEFYESKEIKLEGIGEINGEEHYAISMISKKTEKTLYQAYYLLINSKDYGIRNVTFKFNTYSSKGHVAGMVHYSASYEKIKKKYYLSNIDILLTKFDFRNLPEMKRAFYFNSMQFAEIKTKKIERIYKGLVITKDAHYKNFSRLHIISDLITPIDWQYIKGGKFMAPIRDCFECALNNNQAVRHVPQGMSN